MNFDLTRLFHEPLKSIALIVIIIFFGTASMYLYVNTQTAYMDYAECKLGQAINKQVVECEASGGTQMFMCIQSGNLGNVSFPKMVGVNSSW